jgi:uncharacterized membrane protein
MNKLLKTSILISAITLALVGVVKAEDGTTSSSTRRLPPNIDGGMTREQIEQRREKQIQEMEQKREEQKQLLEQKREEQKQIMETRREELKGIREDNQADRQENRREMRMDVFNIHKLNVVRQLNRALDNLKQVRERVATRITKAASSSRDMTQAKALLVTADAKIAAAQAAINIVSSYVPPVSTSTATSTDTTNLDKPRVIAAGAIQAIKDAKDALQAVVVEIAHSMGLKLGDDRRNATSTATSTNSTATTTATSTNSTATTTATSTATSTNP